MVMKLDRSVDLPIVELNQFASEPKDHEQVMVIGLGSTQTRMSQSKNSNHNAPSLKAEISEGEGVLQKVDVNIVPHDKCNGHSMFNGGIDEETMICAGKREGGKDACHGDSGSPLLSYETGKFVQVGVVSFGSGCARADRPGVYSRVSVANEWVHQQICILADNPPASCNH
eukprot:scaffold990_cov108-Cylindrotheca_fusiformis.AAC.5